MSEIKPPSTLLTMLEGRALAEAGQLMLVLPLLRLHAKRGAGEPIMVLPGFMADDRSTLILRNFLSSIGYKVFPWGHGVNRRPMLQLLPALAQQLSDIARETDQKIRLVGWSRGGMLSRELARDYPGLVDRVVTIGSPVKGGISASAIGRWVQQETGLTPQQMAKITETRNRSPITVPVKAIYSRTDGIVAWKSCIDDVTADVEHYEILGSHAGMGSNIEVFRLLPRLLKN